MIYFFMQYHYYYDANVSFYNQAKKKYFYHNTRCLFSKAFHYSLYVCVWLPNKFTCICFSCQDAASYLYNLNFYTILQNIMTPDTFHVVVSASLCMCSLAAWWLVLSCSMERYCLKRVVTIYVHTKSVCFWKMDVILMMVGISQQLQDTIY